MAKNDKREKRATAPEKQVEAPEKQAEEVEAPEKQAEEVEAPEKQAEAPEKQAEEVEAPEKQAEEAEAPGKLAKAPRKRVIQHHPAATAAFICSIRPPGQQSGLTIKTDDSLDADLSKFADMTVLVDDAGSLLDNKITDFLRHLNAWEYKGPGVSVGWDTVHQASSYIHLKALAHQEATGEGLTSADLTVTLVCHRYPRNFFKSLSKLKIDVDNPEAGIYQIDRGSGTIGVQVIVIPQLNINAYPIIHALSPADSVKDVEACVTALAGYSDQQDARYAARIVNYILRQLPKEIKDALKEVKTVNEALLEYANPEYLVEIKKWQNEATKKGRKAESEAKRADSEAKRADNTAKKLQIAENRAEQAENRAEQAENRAEQAENRAEQAENKIVELEAEIARLMKERAPKK